MTRRYSFPLLAISILFLSLSSCAQTRDTTYSQQWAYPLPGATVISPYGGRGGRVHSGTDLKTKPNDNILAAFDGEVLFSGTYHGYGNLIRIKHANGLETYYSHNSKNLVKSGDRVKAGQVIALTGRTGRATTEHLHFEIRINGQHVNSARFFDHTRHELRTDAFRKSEEGLVAKSAKSEKISKKTKKAKKGRKTQKTKKSKVSKKSKKSKR